MKPADVTLVVDRELVALPAGATIFIPSHTEALAVAVSHELANVGKLGRVHDRVPRSIVLCPVDALPAAFPSLVHPGRLVANVEERHVGFVSTDSSGVAQHNVSLDAADKGARLDPPPLPPPLPPLARESLPVREPRLGYHRVHRSLHLVLRYTRAKAVPASPPHRRRQRLAVPTRWKICRAGVGRRDCGRDSGRSSSGNGGAHDPELVLSAE